MVSWRAWCFVDTCALDSCRHVNVRSQLLTVALDNAPNRYSIPWIAERMRVHGPQRPSKYGRTRTWMVVLRSFVFFGTTRVENHRTGLRACSCRFERGRVEASTPKAKPRAMLYHCGHVRPACPRGTSL